MPLVPYTPGMLGIEPTAAPTAAPGSGITNDSPPIPYRVIGIPTPPPAVSDPTPLTVSYSFPASALWLVAHGLGRHPAVTAVDTAGDEIRGDLTYLDADTLQVAFGFPVSGTLYLN